ncbi:MAG: hypothetical protein ACLPX7_08505 [Xanthobacteraceae bacterium]
MKYVLRSIFVLTFAALAATSASVKSDAAGRTIYDGEWSVDIVTVRGDCERTLRYSVRIVDGRVHAGEITYDLGGAVSPAGEIHVTVEEKGRSATGTGKLTRDTGHGQWHTSTNQCAGHWTAARRS